MKKLYVIQHLGLGDHIVTNGIIRQKALSNDKVIIFCRNFNYLSVKALFEDDNKIEVVALEDEWNHPVKWTNLYKIISKAKDGEILQLGFRPIALHEGASFDDSFYVEANLSFDLKWKNFKIPEKYILKSPKVEKYAFVHQDINRGFKIDTSKIKIPIIEPDFNDKPNILDWVSIIQEASEIHCIDSCFINLIDQLNCKFCANERIYYHYYSRQAGIGAQPHLRKKWIRLNEVPEKDFGGEYVSTVHFNANFLKNKICNLHIIDSNIGDIVSSPLMYFKFKNSVQFDLRKIDDYSVILKNYNIIVGGGGLIWQCHSQMERIALEKNKNIVSWGLGHNSHFVKGEENYPSWMSNYDLHGIRDYDKGYNYVPCVSCMHRGFDKKYSIENDIVFYSHGENEIDIDVDIPRMSNFNPNIDHIIEFIGSAEHVLTNTYHGIYWATLLKKKVAIISPFSSRFSTMKHKQPFCDHTNWKEVLFEKTQIYPDYLDECRSLNVQHYRKVKELFN